MEAAILIQVIQSENIPVYEYAVQSHFKICGIFVCTLYSKYLCSPTLFTLKHTHKNLYHYFLQGPPRLSNLEAPIMQLSGHEGEIYTAKFSPDGQMIASSGFDRLICQYLLNTSTKWDRGVISGAQVISSILENIWVDYVLILPQSRRKQAQVSEDNIGKRNKT